MPTGSFPHSSSAGNAPCPGHRAASAGANWNCFAHPRALAGLGGYGWIIPEGLLPTCSWKSHGKSLVWLPWLLPGFLWRNPSSVPIPKSQMWPGAPVGICGASCSALSPWKGFRAGGVPCAKEFFLLQHKKLDGPRGSLGQRSPAAQGQLWSSGISIPTVLQSGIWSCSLTAAAGEIWDLGTLKKFQVETGRELVPPGCRSEVQPLQSPPLSSALRPRVFL